MAAPSQTANRSEGETYAQRPALRGTSVRISLAAFIEERDVDYLVDSLVTLATE